MQRQVARSLPSEPRPGPDAGAAGRGLLYLASALLAIRLLTLPLVPITDPTEARYAESAKEMLAFGDFVTPHVWVAGEQVPYLGKPPLHFWMMSASYAIFGVNAFAARLPALLSALLLLLVAFRVLDRFHDRDLAISSVLIMATCPFFFFIGGSAAMDMLLTSTCGGAYFAYYGFLMESEPAARTRWGLLVAFLLGLGMLAKGPVAVLLFGMPTLLFTAMQRQWGPLRSFPWLQGALVFAVVSLPWYLLNERANPGFLKYFFLNENLLRYVVAESGDRYGSGPDFPYGTAILFMSLAVLPWLGAVALVALRRRPAPRYPSSGSSLASSYFLLGFGSIVAFLSFSRQQTAAYVLPAVPPFAAWVALKLRESGATSRSVQRFALTLAACYAVVLLVAVPVVDRRASTRKILQIAAEYRDRAQADGRIIFVGRIPYSAYFYGGDRIFSHDAQKVPVCLRRYVGRNPDDLYILKKSDVRDVPPELAPRLEELDSYGIWAIYRERLAATTGLSTRTASWP